MVWQRGEVRPSWVHGTDSDEDVDEMRSTGLFLDCVDASLTRNRAREGEGQHRNDEEGDLTLRG